MNSNSAISAPKRLRVAAVQMIFADSIPGNLEKIEDAATKPMWRSAVRYTRCLVPSLGWYEWQEQGAGRGKQPYFIHLPQMELFHFAGLWSSWTPKGGEPILSFAGKKAPPWGRRSKL